MFAQIDNYSNLPIIIKVFNNVSNYTVCILKQNAPTVDFRLDVG